MARKPATRQQLKVIGKRLSDSLGARTTSRTVVPGLSTHVQLGPLTSDQLIQLGANIRQPTNYRLGLEDLLQKYMDTVLEMDRSGENFKNLIPSVNTRLKHLKRNVPELYQEELMDFFSRENFDISIFNRQAANAFYDNYRGAALSIDDLIKKFGLPRSYWSV